MMNKLSNKFTFGNDPEFMVKQGGQVVSAIPIIKGDKHDKTDLGGGYFCFHDNVLLETNILPGDTKDVVLGNIKTGISKIAMAISGSYELTTQASHDFTPEECSHEHARVVGCSVEYCAYTGQECTPPNFQGTKRSAGGHIHLGRSDFKEFIEVNGNTYWPKDGKNVDDEVLLNDFSKLQVIKLMDVVVGMSLVLIDKDPTSPARKSLYGKAGRLRPCPYGVEYRTPSNYWLSSPKLASLIYDLSMYVLGIADSGNADAVLSQFNENDVQQAINDNDVALASTILEVGLAGDSALLQRVLEAAKLEVSSLYAEWAI